MRQNFIAIVMASFSPFQHPPNANNGPGNSQLSAYLLDARPSFRLPKGKSDLSFCEFRFLHSDKLQFRPVFATENLQLSAVSFAGGGHRYFTKLV